MVTHGYFRLAGDWPSWRSLLEGRSQDRQRGESSLAYDCSCPCCSPAAYRSDSKSHPCAGRETRKRGRKVKTVTISVTHGSYKMVEKWMGVKKMSYKLQEFTGCIKCSYFSDANVPPDPLYVKTQSCIYALVLYCIEQSHFYRMPRLERPYPIIMCSFSRGESCRSSVGPSPIKICSSSVKFSGWLRRQQQEELSYTPRNNTEIPIDDEYDICADLLRNSRSFSISKFFLPSQYFLFRKENI